MAPKNLVIGMAAVAISINYIADSAITAALKKAMQDNGEGVALGLGYTIFEFPVKEDDPNKAFIGSLMDASTEEVNSFLNRIKIIWRPTRWEMAKRYKYLGREELSRESIQGDDKIMYWDSKTGKAYTEYRGCLKWNAENNEGGDGIRLLCDRM